MNPLVAIETHPIQYHAPVYRSVQQRFGIPVTVIYGSDCSVAGYRDTEFGTSFAWDTDLTSGYDSVFLSREPVDHEASTSGLGKVLRKLKPSAVLSVGYSPMFHQIAFLQAWNSGVPILFRGETSDHARCRSAFREFARARALALFYARCAKLLYVGEHSQQHFRRLGVPETKLLFSPYCVDMKSFRTSERDRRSLRDSTREQLHIGSHEIVVLFSGKLSERKGPDLLLAGVKTLPPEVRDRIVVLFLGSGAMETNLKDRARQAPDIKVRFVGFQNQSQLSPYYHAADLLVLPSRHSETWGLVVNEALHHGLPCVVSKAVGCQPDLIIPGRTGETFETNSTDSLAAAIVKVLALVGQSDIRDTCRERVSGYTVERAAEGIAEAYWSVVGAKKGVGVQCQNLG